MASEELNCWSEVWSQLASEELLFELDDQMMSVSVRRTRFSQLNLLFTGQKGSKDPVSEHAVLCSWHIQSDTVSILYRQIQNRNSL